MIKFLILSLILVSVFSCDKQNYDGYYKKRFELKHGLGYIEMYFPESLDTTYSWISYSDHSCGHFVVNRVANKKYCLLSETGFYYPFEPDSLYQITIKYPMREHCIGAKNLKINDTILTYIEDSYLKINPNIKFEILEIKSVGNQDFAVVAYSVVVDKLENIFISAITAKNDYVIEIEFECLATDCKRFIEKMLVSIGSIKIGNKNS